MQKLGDFKLPQFFSYPPYFTYQSLLQNFIFCFFPSLSMSLKIMDWWKVCFFLYFSLQPVRDTREKQIQLWKELILDYCKAQKIFLINVEEDFPLFSNSAIDSNDPLSAFFTWLQFHYWLNMLSRKAVS